MKAKVTILGCGNSTGVPAIGNVWGKCDPREPKNRRLRASIAVRSETTTLVIDTGPDFREQLNRENISTLNAVLYTHAHGDHINGIDELKLIYFRTANLVPIYGNSWTLEDLERRFDYLFKGGKHELYPPMLRSIELQYGQAVTIGDLTFTSFEQDHASCTTAGYRLGDFGYSTDMRNLDDTAVNALKGIRTWIVDGAGYNDPNAKLHANLETIYKLNERIGAEQVYITSLSLGMDYKTLCAELKSGFAPAYDGLEIDISLNSK